MPVTAEGTTDGNTPGDDGRKIGSQGEPHYSQIAFFLRARRKSEKKRREAIPADVWMKVHVFFLRQNTLLVLVPRW
ncbi:hypothetical protein KM043_008101 [Ampulex compressa]|nr:hypothetical protein KM043_008101 [Ampulex compressa]